MPEDILSNPIVQYSTLASLIASIPIGTYLVVRTIKAANELMDIPRQQTSTLNPLNDNGILYPDTSYDLTDRLE